MRLAKLKIKQVKDLSENLEVEAGNWTIQDGKVVTFEVEHKEISKSDIEKASDLEKKILEDIQKKIEEDLVNFTAKNQIRAGYHKFDQNDGMVEITKSDEIFFDTSTSLYLKRLFENFFEKTDLLKNKFKRSKRAYLLHSPPGMGKSALIREFCRHALKKDGTAVVVVDGDINFGALNSIFLKPYADGVTRIILVIEDFGKKDNALNGTIYNPSCLNFLDGTSGLFRVPTMILCTTNFARDLGAHLTNRPGRFNKIIEVMPPTDEEIFRLVEAIGGVALTESQRAAFRGQNMTPDHVIEAIIRHEIEEISLEESINQVIKEREGLVQW